MPHSHPHSLRSVCRKLRRANTPSMRARGFTLVELMVVIGIIGMLTAISVPIVMQALAKARNAAIKAEIDMLHMAIMNYKNQYGAFPPCVSGTAATEPAARHVLRAFPRTADITAEIQGPVTVANSLVGWLSGYTNNPRTPVSSGERQRIFGFDKARISSTNQYHPPKLDNSPYLYITPSSYGTISSGTTNASFTVGPNTYSPEIQVTTSGTAFFNPDTFQILCAGRDGEWPSDDDLSNFWPGTRREYEDSLQ